MTTAAQPVQTATGIAYPFCCGSFSIHVPEPWLAVAATDQQKELLARSRELRPVAEMRVYRWTLELAIALGLR